MNIPFKNIIFSKTPLNSSLVYKKEFKIYPIPFEDYPRNNVALHFPLVLESYTSDQILHKIPEDFKSVSDIVIKTTNQINRVRQITNLLTSFTNHRFFTYESMDGSWGVGLPVNKESITDKLNNKSSEWCMNVFYWPDLKSINEYNFRKMDFNTEKYIPFKDYFLNNPFDNNSVELNFPDTIHYTLDSYFSLDNKSRKSIDAITHLISNSIDLQKSMKSLSFLSSVSAIETLINLEYKSRNENIEFKCQDCKTISSSPHKCHKCNSPIWGIAVKFREFLKEYVAYSDESVRKYKKIYNVRSKIVHDGMLLVGDNEFDWANYGVSEQWKLHIETLQLSRLALHNWLIRKASESILARKAKF